MVADEAQTFASGCDDAAAAGLREPVASGLTRLERLTVEEDIAEARSVLGHEAFAAEWTVSKELSLDEAISFAME